MVQFVEPILQGVFKTICSPNGSYGYYTHVNLDVIDLSRENQGECDYNFPSSLFNPQVEAPT